ncbi:MAG TPA: beta-ketoacyl synthase N-terminal-like domain-containing protein, partial [Solirubrobacterales bacterium]|nr:beta-ketoacyl synthase N-terminal-like domain-containing protein [Solirubrobacterales bacterium]
MRTKVFFLHLRNTWEGEMGRAKGDGSLIAVVGMSCRLPRAPNPEAYWRLLESAGDAIGPVPSQRWSLAGSRPGEDLDAGDEGVQFGAFLAGIDLFDPEFFGISPREAAQMDPQQRLVLELGWEALEDARIPPGGVAGSSLGIFLGTIKNDYENLNQRRPAAGVDRYTMTGQHRSMIANRVSYALGATGPSLTVDTAQSSSLVAVHLACESLRRGEASMALAGGVHLNLDPHSALGASRLGALSPDGRCFTFDARANGFVRGEGGGIVVLKQLQAAIEDGDQVRAVIRGSAMNNDGHSAGLTVPSRSAQERLLRNAHRRARLEPSSVQYVELHGSGTPVGDPIEAAALGAALGSERADGDPLPVGSVKTNIGHLEGAAGIAGLIKTVLAIENRQIPASLNFERPSPKIPLDELRLRVQGETGAWPHQDAPLIAGVSSFGVGGTNCHVVVAEPPQQAAVAPRRAAEKPESTSSCLIPLLLSARSAPAVREQAQRLAAHLRAHPEIELVDAAFSLATKRDRFEHRAVVLSSEREEQLEGLAALARNESIGCWVAGTAASEPGSALIFPGLGSQWEGMGRELIESSSVFRAQVHACTEALEPYFDWSLDDVLRGSDGAPPVDRSDVAQPALFTMMTGLAELWRSVGVEPSAVAGHSQGEIVAAYVAGGLSLQDAALVLVARNRVLRRLEGKGVMASVALPVAELEERLEDRYVGLGVAAINGPASAVLSGDIDALDAFLVECKADGVRASRIRGTFVASHSAQVDSLRDELLADLSVVAPRSGEIPFHSTVTGERLDTAELDAEYWFRNVRETVRLDPTIRGLLKAGIGTFIEVSPHPVLTVGVSETVEDAAMAVSVSLLSTLRREEGGPQRFARSLAEAQVAGVEVDWSPFCDISEGRSVALPTYPFQRERFWLEVPPRVSPASGDGEPDDLCLRESWDLIPDPPEVQLSGTWLVITSPLQQADARVGEAVNALAGHGAEVVRVEFDREADTASLFASLRERAMPDRVISLLALGGAEQGGSPASCSLETLSLLQEMTRAELRCPIHLVTSGAVSVGDADPLRNPLQAQLWGLGRTLAVEEQDRWGGLLDIPESLDDRTLGRLAGLLEGLEAEDQVAVRDDGAFVRRLVPASAPDDAGADGWRTGGTALVIGGVGRVEVDLGLWLSGVGIDHLVLALPPGDDGHVDVSQLEETLSAAGVGLTATSCDPADREDLEGLLGSVPERHPLRAVFYVSPDAASAKLREADAAGLHSGLGRNLSAALNLHELTEKLDLSAFVLCYLGISAFGAPTRGVLGAQHAFLEALIHSRREGGLPGTAISWGGWDAFGFEEGESRYGIRALSREAAFSGLEWALITGEPALVIADIDWERFIPLYCGDRLRSQVEHLPGVRRALKAITDRNLDEAKSQLTLSLAGLSLRDRQERLLKLVSAEVAAVLGHGSAAAIEPATAFKDLGFDSLAAVELRSRLQAASGLRLGSTVVFDHPTASSMAAHISLKAMGGTQTAGSVAWAQATEEPIAIVGMACRYPGEVGSPNALWELLTAGRDAIAEFPADRGWDLERLFHPDPDHPGTSYSRRGGFLEGAGEFDAEFFGIAP